MKLNYIWLILLCPALCLGVGVGDYPKLVYDIYVDGSTDNLWPTDAASYPNLSDWLISPAVADKWYPKIGSAAAINGTAFQGYGTALPQLTMAVDGLDMAKVYDVYGVFWVKKKWTGSEYWYTLIGISGNELLLGDYDSADVVFNEGVFSIQGVEKFLGQVSGVESFTVDIDGPETDWLSRAWFDGIALVEAKVDSVMPTVGQHDYTNGEVVQLNAYDYVDCPEVCVFERWVGDVTDPYLPQTTVIMDGPKTVTAVFNYFEGAACGDLCHPILPGDVNDDCMVDLMDLAIMAKDWF